MWKLKLWPENFENLLWPNGVMDLDEIWVAVLFCHD